MENICGNGHVLDPGKELCSRCNRPAVSNEVAEETLPEEPKAKKKVVKKVVKAKK